MRCQGGKEQRTAEQRRRTESYGNATYEVSQRQGVIERSEEHQLCDQRRCIEEKHWL